MTPLSNPGAVLADDQVSLVKNANDIVDVIKEHVSLTKRGRTYKGLCPFHDDHNPSMDVDPVKQRFRCWSCGKFGDVITFVQERERVTFREALELLARRANIKLDRTDGEAAKSKARMLDLMKWAEEQFRRFLLDAGAAAAARDYLAARGLSPETVKKYGLGYAPDDWNWLTPKALKAGWPLELLVAVGLTGRPEDGRSHYDRFRDRIMFPIRDVRGRTVGFGGRILPGNPKAAQLPKYYNSSDTPLFSKSENLYGLDQAREAGEKAGFLAVVEGYTDVLMAHQHGVMPVVATLGTALNVRHISQVRRFVPKVILVYDADAGGMTGVDRALELFVSANVELAVATLPEGLDPCDLLVAQGADAFRAVLASAVDALDFKLNRMFTPEATAGVEGRRRAIDSVLQVLALAPELPGQTGALKMELTVSRVAQRAGVHEATVWDRLRELREEHKKKSGPAPAARPPAGEEAARQAPAPRRERELAQVLLAEPALVDRARGEVGLEEIEHPGIRRLLAELFALAEAGEPADIDRVRARLADNPRLAEAALKLQAEGQAVARRQPWFEELVEDFRRVRRQREVHDLRGRLRGVPGSEPVPVALLKQLQEKRLQS
jgi:DNA primase